MRNDVSYVVIARFLTGEASEADVKKIKMWIEESRLEKNDIEELKSAWEQAVFKEKDIKIINQKEVRDKVWQQSFKKTGKSLSGSGRKINMVYFMKIAASILIFITAFASVYTYIYKSAHQPQVVTWEQKQNPSGEKSKIYLPDGVCQR